MYIIRALYKSVKKKCELFIIYQQILRGPGRETCSGFPQISSKNAKKRLTTPPKRVKIGLARKNISFVLRFRTLAQVASVLHFVLALRRPRYGVLRVFSSVKWPF
jgi:hypothetical protein